MPGADAGDLRQALDRERLRNVGLDVAVDAPQACRCKAAARASGDCLATSDTRQDGKRLHCPALGEQFVQAVRVTRLAAQGRKAALQIFVAEGDQRPVEVAAGVGRNGRVEEDHRVVEVRGYFELAFD
ncbi:hypothetical protein D3C86_1174130 [compost metagenome]